MNSLSMLSIYIYSHKHIDEAEMFIVVFVSVGDDSRLGNSGFGTIFGSVILVLRICPQVV